MAQQTQRPLVAAWFLSILQTNGFHGYCNWNEGMCSSILLALACLLYTLCPEYVSKYGALEKTKEISKIKCTLYLYFKAKRFEL